MVKYPAVGSLIAVSYCNKGTLGQDCCCCGRPRAQNTTKFGWVCGLCLVATNVSRDLCLVTQIAFDGVAEAAHSMSRVRRERYALGGGALSLGSSSSMVLRVGSSLSG